jgi:hypothetical protein
MGLKTLNSRRLSLNGQATPQALYPVIGVKREVVVGYKPKMDNKVVVAANLFKWPPVIAPEPV